MIFRLFVKRLKTVPLCRCDRKLSQTLKRPTFNSGSPNMIPLVVIMMLWSTLSSNAFQSTSQRDSARATDKLLCGERFINDEDKRIVGGSQSEAGAWPWQVALLFQPINDTQVCGGSLISPEWVVTAAHCFKEFGGEVDPTKWEVVLGDHHLKNEDWFEQSRSARAIYIHPRYEPAMHQPFNRDSLLSVPPDYDLAIIRLSWPVHIDKYVFPICLLPKGVRFNSGKECYVSGWGHVKHNGPKASTLRQAKVQIVDQDKCNGVKSYKGQVHGRALCAGFEQGGVDACQYDSGGPLSCEHEGRWYLTGVVSWGHECGRPHKYGVYADMGDMTEWVVDTINQYKND